MYGLVRRLIVLLAVALVLEGTVMACASLYLRPKRLLTVGTVFGVCLLVLGLVHLWVWHLADRHF